jgi:hypothetical protein
MIYKGEEWNIGQKKEEGGGRKWTVTRKDGIVVTTLA